MFMESARPYSKVIGVYGSANTQPGSPDYLNAIALGGMLAEAGFAVMTGGYGGVMGAISQGAADAGGHVIGVTVGLFKDRGLVPNNFLHEDVHLPTLAERLNYLILKPDAYVVLRGGAGTLAEMSLAWSLLQVGEIPARPMVLVGPMWQDFVNSFGASASITPNDLRWLTLVESHEAVVDTLNSWWATPPTITLRAGDVQKTPLLGDQE
jgi:uncharacterized protein (TIGR00730 family)